MTDFVNILYEGRAWCNALEADDDIKSHISSTAAATTTTGTKGNNTAHTNYPHPHIKTTGRFKFLSYNVLADVKCTNIRYTTSKQWEYRIDALIREIKSYNADILCLQDVDKFDDVWRPRLVVLGYDSIYQKRTDVKEYNIEGVVIAYKRDLFQLFKTKSIELNCAAELYPDKGSQFIEKCKTDNVGLVALLQPWTIGHSFTSAVCVCSAQCCDKVNYGDVRIAQVQYICNVIQQANSEFHLPVVLGISLNDEPNSGSYHILRTGRRTLTEELPAKPLPPTCQANGRSIVKVSWLPPPKTLSAELKILSYYISWRPGGSRTLGFRTGKQVLADDCIQYEVRMDEYGNKKSIKLQELCANICELTSDLSYEFKVAACNSIGMGPTSDASRPILMCNPSKYPKMPTLKYLRTMQQVYELREQQTMEDNDIDAESAVASNPIASVTQLTPRDVDGKKLPTMSRSRALPISMNAREGWRVDLTNGVIDAKLKQELLTKEFLVNHPLLRDQYGNFSDIVSDTPHSTIAFVDTDVSSIRFSAAGVDAAGVDTAGVDTAGVDTAGVDTTITTAGADTYIDGTDVCTHNEELELTETEDASVVHTVAVASVIDGTSITEDDSQSLLLVDTMMLVDLLISEDNHQQQQQQQQLQLQLQQVDDAMYTIKGIPTVQSIDVATTFKDDTILDLKDTVLHLGHINSRQLHDLNMTSAYEAYSSGGEPIYTYSAPNDVKCYDYIFYSSNLAVARKVLSIPEITSLNGDDPSKLINGPNKYWKKPYRAARYLTDHSIDTLNKVGSNKKKLSEIINKCLDVTSKADGYDNSGDHFWLGNWRPMATPNPSRSHCWLPNDTYASSHMAIGVEVEILDQYLSVQWV